MQIEAPLANCMSFREYLVADYGWPLFTEDGQPSGDSRHAGRKYGYIVIDADGNAVKAIDRTNPNAKWDWWVFGGRFCDQLRRKGVQKSCDAARFGDLDLTAMAATARADREKLIVGFLARSAQKTSEAPLTRDELERGAKAYPALDEHGDAARAATARR